MSLDRIRPKKNLWYLVVQIAIIAVPLSLCLHLLSFWRITLWQGILSALFLLIFVLLPGFIAVRPLKLCGVLLWAFALNVGLCICGLVYFTTFALGLRVLFLFIMPILGAVGLAGIIFDIKRTGFKSFLLPPTAIFISLCFTLASIAVTLRYSQPDISGHADYLWMLGNVNSYLFRAFPTNIHLAATPLRYHSFSFIVPAAAIYTTGIAADIIYMALEPIVSGFAIILSLFALAKRFLGDGKRIFLFVLSVMLASSVTPDFDFIWGGSVLGITPGFDFALPIFIICSILCFDFSRYGGIYRLSIAAILTLALFGSKSPGAIVLCAAIAVSAALSLRSKEGRRTAVFSAVTIAASGTAYLLWILKSAQQIGGSGNGYSISFYPGFAVRYSDFFINTVQPILHRMNIDISIPFFENVSILFALPLHILGSFGIFGVLCLIFTMMKLHSPKKLCTEDLLIMGLSGGGVVCYYLFWAVGRSETYFPQFSWVYIVLCGFLWFFENFRTCGPLFRRYLFWFGTATILLCFITSVYTYGKPITENIRLLRQSLERVEPEPEINFMTGYERQAMQWLHDNTATDVIIATDRHSTDPAQKAQSYFYFSAYSGRQMYVEGWTYSILLEKIKHLSNEPFATTEEIYRKDNPNRLHICNENNIDYIIVSSFINPTLKFKEPGITAVFNNRDITIYKVDSA